MNLTIKQLLGAVLASCVWIVVCFAVAFAFARMMRFDDLGLSMAGLVALIVAGVSLGIVWWLLPDALEHQDELRKRKDAEEERFRKWVERDTKATEASRL